MKVIQIEDMEHNFIKLLINEEFYKYGSCSLELKIDRMVFQDTLWIFRGELLEFLEHLEQMYSTMKGQSILADSEGCIEVKYKFDKRGYVIIECEYRASTERKMEIKFELLSTQPQMLDTIKTLKDVLSSK